MRQAKLHILTLAAVVALFAAACGKEAPKEEQPVKKAPAAVVQPQVAAQPAETSVAPAVTERPGRNPFQSHIILMAGTEKGRKVKGPLECCELSVFKLLAVVSGGDKPTALVQAPDGKRYIVKKGDLMGPREGRITGIEARIVVIRENIVDDTGKVVSTTDFELKLPGGDKDFEPFKP